jgi:hypothetical protein
MYGHNALPHCSVQRASTYSTPTSAILKAQTNKMTDTLTESNTHAQKEKEKVNRHFNTYFGTSILFFDFKF